MLRVMAKANDDKAARNKTKQTKRKTSTDLRGGRIQSRRQRARRLRNRAPRASTSPARRRRARELQYGGPRPQDRCRSRFLRGGREHAPQREWKACHYIDAKRCCRAAAWSNASYANCGCESATPTFVDQLIHGA